MKIGGVLLIVVLFGGAAAGTLQAGFHAGAAVLAGIGVLCLWLWRRGNA